MAPIEHLSADRLGDMVNAVRSSPPDLATLPRPHDDLLDAPEEDYSSAPAKEYYSAPEEVFSPPPPSPAYEAPPAPEPSPPVEIAPDYTWEDSLPPAVLPAAEETPVSVRAMPDPAFNYPAVPEVPASRAARRKKGGRHRQPPSVKHFGRGMARSLRSAFLTPRVVALLGIIGLLVVATTVLGAL
jgi:hypothetical protein